MLLFSLNLNTSYTNYSIDLKSERLTDNPAFTTTMVMFYEKSAILTLKRLYFAFIRYELNNLNNSNWKLTQKRSFTLNMSHKRVFKFAFNIEACLFYLTLFKQK